MRTGGAGKFGKAGDDEDGEAGLNKMSGMNLNDLKYLDEQKKLSMISFLNEKIKAEKEAKR